MIRILLVASLCWTCTAAAQEIYRWQNQDGSTTYSDQPPPPSANGGKVEREELPELHVVPALKAPTGPAQPEPDEEHAAKIYQHISIAQPQPDSAVRANDGNLSIVLDLRPALRADAGHLVHLYLDGGQVAQGAQTHFQLSNLDRGTHNVRAEVKNSEDRVLISSSVVSFTLLRHSNLF